MSKFGSPLRLAAARVLSVANAERRRRTNFSQQRRHTAPVGVHLQLGPRIAAVACVLGLDADEARVAGVHALPGALAGMVAAAGSDHWNLLAILDPVSGEEDHESNAEARCKLKVNSRHSFSFRLL